MNQLTKVSVDYKQFFFQIRWDNCLQTPDTNILQQYVCFLEQYSIEQEDAVRTGYS